jgi:uncharacterized protein (TIGR02118 family)
MIHRFYFMGRRSDLSLEQFLTYWRTKHPRAVSTPVTQIRRYIQSHRAPEMESTAPFDGIAETWHHDFDDMLSLVRSPVIPIFKKDEENFVNHAHAEDLTTTDRVILDGPRGKEMLKAIFTVKRPPEMTLAEFRCYWQEVHAPIAIKLPGLRRYVQCAVIDEVYSFAEPKWDGIAQLWFDNPEAVRATFQSDYYKNESGPDSQKFIGQSAVVWVHEHPVLPKQFQLEV